MNAAVSSSKPFSAQLEQITFLCLPLLGFVGIYLLKNGGHWPLWSTLGLVGLGAIGISRWCWFFLRIVRSWVYCHWVFPRWRKFADRVPLEALPHMCFLVPTYKEKAWITERVFRAIAQEARTLGQPITLLVNSSSDQENASIQAILQQEDPQGQTMRLIFMTQKDGKRKAMADALRVLQSAGLPEDTVIALMDGDSELTPGTLRKCLPFFCLFPRMGALTTDELPVVEGSLLFSEWFHLRFAQRHYQMCADSLSRKVLCLTGRFSLFRATAALDPSFANQLENDTLNDWLWGRFKFLSGDDKSTWFWLLQRRYQMLYIPDALVLSIETISGSVIDRAYQNMRRWYGNMLRSNGRAIALGPATTGWLTWISLIDQRVNIWTSLLTPAFLLVSLSRGNWGTVGAVLCWLLFSRPLALMLIFWGRPSHLKLIHFPILLLTQWGSSLVKIWTQMNLARQSWSNRGIQGISAEGSGHTRHLKLGVSRFLLTSQLLTFSLLICWLSGVLNPLWDLAGFWLPQKPWVAAPILRLDATRYGVIGSDGQDDTAALQALLDGEGRSALEESGDRLTQITLPIGEIDLSSPLHIRRSDVILQGQGTGRTILKTHFDRQQGEAVLIIRPDPPSPARSPGPIQDWLENVKISGFSLRQAGESSTGESSTGESSTGESRAEPGDRPAGATLPPPDAIDGIVLERVARSSVRNLYLEQGNRYPLVLSDTREIAVEQVTLHNSQSPEGIVLRNAQRTWTRGIVLNHPPS